MPNNPSKPQSPPLSSYQELMLVAERRRAEEAAARIAAEQSPAPNLAIVHGASNAAQTTAKPVVNSISSSVDSSSLPPDDSRLLSIAQIRDLWTAEGASGVFTSSRISRIQQAQDALTHREEKVYDILWGVKSVEISRLSQIGYTELARRARVDRRTVIRLVERLIDKGYISVAKGADPRTITATVYRVLSYGSVLKFQKETGRLWILKTGTGVFYARRLSGPVDSSSSPPVDSSAPQPVVSIASPPVVSGARIKEGSKKEDREEESTSSSSFFEVAVAVRKIAPGADDDYISSLMQKCRNTAADATADEIAYFVRVKGDQARNSRRVSSLTGFLLEAVPKCLAGTLLTGYRDAKRQEREREIANWRAILADPDSDDEFKQTALDELGRLGSG